MTPEDINFLESQGCFRVPIRPLLDHFVQEYFLHVHPGLPIIDEGVFWEMYTHRSYHPAEHPRITLFVFQAIIFASCCVSDSALSCSDQRYMLKDPCSLSLAKSFETLVLATLKVRGLLIIGEQR
jgi:hypothetical protein